MWGVSVEGVNATGYRFGIVISISKHSNPIYTILHPQQKLVQHGSISYLLLNFEQYYTNNPKIQPYGGLGLGAAFYQGDFVEQFQKPNLHGI